MLYLYPTQRKLIIKYKDEDCSKMNIIKVKYNFLVILFILTNFLYEGIFTLHAQEKIFIRKPKIAILPLKLDNVSNAEGRIVTIFLQRKLSKYEIYELINTDVVEDALQDTEVDDLVEAGIAYFKSIKLDKAMQLFNKANNIIEEDISRLHSSKALIDIHCYLGVIYLHKNYKTKAIEEFTKVIKINPDKRLDEEFFPTEVVNLFNEVREDFLKMPRGTIKVDSSPPGAKVYIDSFMKGVTPITINDLTVGEHYLTVEKENFQTWSRKIVVDFSNIISFYANLVPIDIYQESIKIGQIIGSDYILLGFLSKELGEFKLVLKIIDLQKNKTYSISPSYSMIEIELVDISVNKILYEWGNILNESSLSLSSGLSMTKSERKRWYNCGWGIGLVTLSSAIIGITLSYTLPQIETHTPPTPFEKENNENSQEDRGGIIWEIKY